MPVTFNEPLSFLQRLSEYLESSYLIDNASDSTDPMHRMEVSKMLFWSCNIICF